MDAGWNTERKLGRKWAPDRLADEIYGFLKNQVEPLSFVSILQENVEQPPASDALTPRRIVHRDATTGITTTREADGRTTRSINNGQGHRFECTTNAQGTMIGFRDSTGSWTSNDGRNWLNLETNERQFAIRSIDRYGQYVMRRNNGEEQILGRSRQLEAILRRQHELSNRYGVTFAKPGDTVDERQSGTVFYCRPPTIDELNCLERILERNRQMNVREIRICFAEARGSQRVNISGAYQHRGSGGGPEIIIFPNSDRPARGFNGLEGVLQHELVHHQQRQSWGEQANWGGRGAPRDTQRLLVDLGWVYDPTSGRHRLLDREGNQWESETNADGQHSGRWIPIIAGRQEPSRAITNSEMRARARVHPISSYFTTPAEIHAEALALFRQDRREMWLRCQREPGGLAFYNLIARYDQEEIDQSPAYRARNGSPRFIRGAEGNIVPNTPANRQAVSDHLRGRRSAQRPQVRATVSPDVWLGSGECSLT